MCAVSAPGQHGEFAAEGVVSALTEAKGQRRREQCLDVIVWSGEVNLT